MGNLMRLKYLCSSFSTPLKQEDVSDKGEYKVYGASGFIGYSNSYGNESNYLGIVKDGAGVGRVSIYNGKTSLLGTMAYIVPNSDVNIDWLKYAIMSLDLGKDAATTTIPHIYFSAYGNRLVNFVPLVKQSQVALFLDCACNEIDSILEKIRASIEEYKKLKQAIITQAVTKGIRGDRPMKESGIEWIRSIPVEWEVIPAKRLFRNSDERKHPDDELLTASQKYGVISQQQYMEKEDTRIVLATQGIQNWKHVEPYDFIISLRSFQGGLEMSEISGCITWHYIVLKALRPMYSFYYKWLFKSDLYIKALQRTCNFIRDGQDIRYSNFVQVPLFIPPMEEQKEIADALNIRCAEVDALIQKKVLFVAELESYKKSLIYEYVTGKKEVSNAAQTD